MPASAQTGITAPSSQTQSNENQVNYIATPDPPILAWRSGKDAAAEGISPRVADTPPKSRTCRLHGPETTWPPQPESTPQIDKVNLVKTGIPATPVFQRPAFLIRFAV
ncbi:hypothetical protein V8E54_002958 [Elaphomyces granulatus]